MFGTKLRQETYYKLFDELLKEIKKIEDVNKKSMAFMYYADIVKNLSGLFLLFNIKDEKFEKLLEEIKED